MKCREVEERLTEWLDGRLAAAATLQFQEHLEACAACRAQAETWTQLQGALRSVAPPAPSLTRLRRMEDAVERGRARPVRARPRRMRWPWAGAVAAACAVVAVLVVRRPDSYATVVALDGTTRLDDRVLAPGDRVAGGHTISVGTGSVTLALGARARLTLSRGARVQLGGPPPHIVLRLDSGQLEAEVAHRAPGESFTVATRDGRVEVRGTRFTVGYDAGGRSWVRVAEGRVAAFGASGERSVSSGEGWMLAPPQLPAEQVAESGTTAPGAAAAQDVVRTPSPSPRRIPRATGDLVEQVRTAMRAGRYDRALSLLDGATIDHAASDELGYLRGEVLRLAGRSAEAVRAYVALDQSSARPAARQNALVAAAQLELRQAHASAARQLYARGLSVAPHGPLADEALLGAMRAARAEGDRAAALALARRYLASYPNGSAVAEARGVERAVEAPSGVE